MNEIKRALLSLSDKKGLIELGRNLVDAGVEIVASGGTARALKEAQVSVTSVADITGYPALLGGRVKTLHPAVHGGILSRDTDEDRAELAKHDLGSIDLVVCNLYPFQRTIAQAEVTFSEAIEQIDIGGVTLLRAAAKNCARVTVVCDPADYDALASQLPSAGTLEWRTKMARKAFLHTAQYDAAIAGYFCETTRSADANLALPSRFGQAAVESQSLRYGENPHQAAALYRWEGESLPYEVLQGKALSYNNLVDLDGALDAVMPFEEPAVAIIKHTNPCGLAVGETLLDAYQKALKSDPVSAFGSIIAVNRTVDVDLLDTIGKLFVEVLAAPAFTPAALSWLAQRKKNCRAIRVQDMAPPALQIRSTRGGLLIQETDTRGALSSEWRCVTAKKPTVDQLNDLIFAWKAAKSVKSNAIVIAQNGATIGVGAGQMNRLESSKIAASLAGDGARGAVLASDAFFPFADGLEAAAECGVAAVVQPGGSIRDDEVIAAADRLGIAMMFTGTRHFKH
ncbi:MAG: bifunctional phosphoribosylaminoimidazolecarboxamide formyltransferase/IMP cyclohydrolase [Bradymonadia bacterium]